MISSAKLRYLRITPRKVRLVADLVRGKTVKRAQSLLSFTQKKATLHFSKLLKQAVANARDNFQVDEKNLYISEILVNEGPSRKKRFPRARGSSDIIHKRTSHVMIVLDEIEKAAKKKISEPVAKKEKKTKTKTKTVQVKKKESKEPEAKEPEKEIKTLTKKTRPKQKMEKAKPKIKGIKSFFRRKSF